MVVAHGNTCYLGSNNPISVEKTPRSFRAFVGLVSYRVFSQRRGQRLGPTIFRALFFPAFIRLPLSASLPCKVYQLQILRLSWATLDVCVCVCVFFFCSSHSFWTSSSLDVPAGVSQEEGHTGCIQRITSFTRHMSPRSRPRNDVARKYRVRGNIFPIYC